GSASGRGSPRRTALWLTRSTRSTRRDGERARRRGSRGAAERVAGPWSVLRESEPSSPGSTFIIVVVSSGGISAHPAAERAGRGRLHATNPDPSGTNHHIKSPRSPREVSAAPRTESSPPRLRGSA